MVDGLLSNFRALDLTDQKGFVCGKILASLGVDVIKIEKPGGDPSRNIPPFYHDIPDQERSLYWFAFNTDKRSITLNLETTRGQELFKKLVEKSDFVLESFTPGYMESLGLGYEELSRINPRIIMTSITPFGQKGPYSQYKGSELIASAMSGVLENNGDPDRAPVKEAPDNTYYEAGASAALGAIISHYHREITGEGQQVDVSIQECAATRNTDNLVAWMFEKRLVKRTGNRGHAISGRPARWIWPCKDGDVFWRAPANNQFLSQWFDEEGIDNPYINLTSKHKEGITIQTGNAVEEAILELFRKYTKKEIIDRSRAVGILSDCVNNPGEVMENPQPASRNFWTGINDARTGITLDYPRHFFLSSETENYTRHSAPSIGEHNNEIYSKELGLSNAEIAELKELNII